MGKSKGQASPKSTAPASAKPKAKSATKSSGGPPGFVRRTASYKRCDLDERKVSLAEALQVSFHKLSVGERRQKNKVTDAEIFLNDLVDLGKGCWAGAVYQITRGARPTKVTVDWEAQRLKTSAIQQLAPDEEVLESALLFLVRSNHVVLTSSGSLRVLHLEDYFNWLTREASQVLKDQVPFRLADERAQGARQDGKLDRVRSLRFSAPLTGEALMSTARQEGSSAARTARVLADLLRREVDDLLGRVELLKADELDKLSVDVQIKYKGRRKKTADWGLLDWLARTMDDDLGDRAEFIADGVTLSGNELKLKEVLKIDVDQDGGLRLESLGTTALTWLEGLLTSGRIRACEVS